MSTPLRPLSTGELLDRTFHLYRNNFMLFAGISAIAGLLYVGALVLLFVLGLGLPRPGAGVEARDILASMALYFGVIAIFYLLGASLAIGATIFAVSKVHLGQQGSIGESYRRVFPRIGSIIVIVLAVIIRMIGMLLLAYLAMIPLGMVMGLIIAGIGGASSTLASILMVIFGIVVIVLVYGLVFRVYLKYSLAINSCLLENNGVGDSLKRSAFLSEGSLWRLFLVHLLMGVIAFALNFAFEWPGQLLFRYGSLAAPVWGFLATFIAYTTSFPISTIAISLVYYDQRVRKEAFDLQLMMESLGEPAPQASASAAPMG